QGGNVGRLPSGQGCVRLQALVTVTVEGDDVADVVGVVDLPVAAATASPTAATTAAAGGLGEARLLRAGDRVAEGGVVARDAVGGVLEEELAVGAVGDVRGTAERAGLALVRAERVAGRATAASTSATATAAPVAAHEDAGEVECAAAEAGAVRGDAAAGAGLVASDGPERQPADAVGVGEADDALGGVLVDDLTAAVVVADHRRDADIA